MLVKSLNYSYKHGELSSSQKEAVIVLIEKKDRDRRQIKNWRPISRINVDVKIGTKPIAKRLEKVLPEIIHHNQNAYVKGRTIFDAVRTIDDIISLTASKDISSLLVAIDFEKAFDSVNWNYLKKTLEKFNFGPSFIAWITTFFSDITSSVMNNGFATQPFKLSRGVRQGDPLFPYLFILVLETLAINIRNYIKIGGIKIDNQELKLVIFADDLTVFLKDKESFYQLSNTLHIFGVYSGLKINKQKTEVMNLGSSRVTAEDLSVEHIPKAVKILGIHFTFDYALFQRLNLAGIFNQPIWNNRFICIDNKSVFSRKLFSAGLCKVGDLCEFICIKPHITESLLNVLDLFYLKCLYHSLPPEWKKEMSSNVTQAANKTTPFNIFAQEELSSKKIYNLLISKISKPPTAKKKLENQYASETSSLDWETIYTLPFKCALDTKSREFQYKILNQILPLNTFLFKICKTESPLCAFCLFNEECMSHFFFQCTVIQSFWSSIQQLFGNHIITESDVILGITHQSEDALLNNHLILLSKQYTYNCKLKGVLPSGAVFLTKVKAVFEMEHRIAKERNKLSIHYKKWNKLLSQEHHIQFPQFSF